MRNLTRKPIVVSLYSSDDYYSESADRLRADCERIGVDSDIVQLDDRENQDWIGTCRSKIPFYVEMIHKHQRPILWLDADSRLQAWPTVFDGLTCDIAGFLRGLRYLPDFDPQLVPRFFAPFALYFNSTRRAASFLELMARLETDCADQATDDYFLQEAWKQHKQQLTITVLPPDLVGHEWPLSDGQAIYVGISGNVSRFKAQAKQQTPALLAPARRKAVLLHEAATARKAGRIGDALVLYRHALEVAPPDDALAEKIARMMRHEGMADEATRFLQTYRAGASATEPPTSTSIWTRLFSWRRAQFGTDRATKTA